MSVAKSNSKIQRIGKFCFEGGSSCKGEASIDMIWRGKRRGVVGGGKLPSGVL